MATNNELKEIIGELKSQLEKEEKDNKQLMMVGGLLLIALILYLVVVNSSIQNNFLNPEALADVSTGFALEAAPEVAGHLRAVVVDGAPDMARMASDAVVDLIPNYRTILEQELRPVVDEVCNILATTAAKKMLESEIDGDIGQSQGLQAAANAVITRLDATLEDAMDEPTEMDGPTPRQMIDASLNQLQVVDSGLKRLAANRGSTEERELVMAWLNVLGQYQEDRDLSDQEAYKAESSAANKKPGAKEPKSSKTDKERARAKVGATATPPKDQQDAAGKKDEAAGGK